MTFDSFDDIMAYALEKEKEAAASYEEAAQQERYSGAKETFEVFAKEERKHEAMLKDFTKNSLKQYKTEKIPDLKRSDYLVDMEYQPGMPYADILGLAQEESKHKLRLETILDDHLAKMGD